MAGGKARPWWWSPGPLAFGLVVGLAGAAVVYEPTKTVDVRDRVTSAGGATFCDPVPLPPGQRVEGTATPPPPPPGAPQVQEPRR